MSFGGCNIVTKQHHKDYRIINISIIISINVNSGNKEVINALILASPTLAGIVVKVYK